VSEPDIPHSCDKPVWDGPYQMTCGRVLVDGKCGRHGRRNASCRYCGRRIVLGKHGWRLDVQDSSGYDCPDAPRGYHGAAKEPGDALPAGPVASSGKTPGQAEYEKFCKDEYRQHRRVWNPWPLLPPEDKAGWEASTIRWPSPGGAAG
jgi:hypothetical protein